MFLHLGEDTVVNSKEIIGIFDMDTSTVSKVTRDFLNKAEKNKKIVYVNYELPKSFVKFMSARLTQQHCLSEADRRL